MENYTRVKIVLVYKTFRTQITMMDLIENEIQKCELELRGYLGASIALGGSVFLNVNDEEDISIRYNGASYRFNTVVNDERNNFSTSPIYWKYAEDAKQYRDDCISHQLDSSKPFIATAFDFHTTKQNQLEFILVTNDILYIGTKYIQKRTWRKVLFTK